ncbi:divalent metal cation transporter [Patescibacteria group bacterium]|nr:divalent metal cation transporter [Patescibacteria group bacterium]
MAEKQNSKLKRIIAVLGPGLITGAADDDPSGIVTYTQAGAQFGLGQLWTILFTLPFLIALQEICGRIGIVTRKGLSAIMKENYSKKLLYAIVFLLLVANTINLGTDLGAIASVSRLFIKAPFAVFAVSFFVIILLLEIFLPYRKYAKILKWLTVTLLAYFVTGFIVVGNWPAIMKATFVPNLQFNFQFFFLVLGVIGTTISPYLFFWQTSEEVEEEDSYFAKEHRLPKVSKKMIANMRLDTFLGMIFSNIASWFMVITGSEVLHANGILQITNAAQAASALQPLVRSFPHSGTIASALFAIGIIGTGLLAIPIFAASSSYAIAEIAGWKEGLNKKFRQARGFYGVIIFGTLVGLLLNFFGVNPMRALVYTAVINGIISVPMIAVILLISNNKKIMGQYTSGFWSNLLAVIALLGMAAGALSFFAYAIK